MSLIVVVRVGGDLIHLKAEVAHPGVSQMGKCICRSVKVMYDMIRLVGKPTMWFPNRSDTNRPVQAQKKARSLKFRI